MNPEFNPIETIRNKTKTLTFAASAAVLSFLSSCEGSSNKESGFQETDFVPIKKRIELAEQRGEHIEKIDTNLLKGLRKDEIDKALGNRGSITEKVFYGPNGKLENIIQVSLMRGDSSIIEVLPKQQEGEISDRLNEKGELTSQKVFRGGPAAFKYDLYDFWVSQTTYDDQGLLLAYGKFDNIFGILQTDSVTYATFYRPIVPAGGAGVPERAYFLHFIIDNNSGAIIFASRGEESNDGTTPRVVRRSYEINSDGSISKGDPAVTTKYPFPTHQIETEDIIDAREGGQLITQKLLRIRNMIKEDSIPSINL